MFSKSNLGELIDGFLLYVATGERARGRFESANPKVLGIATK